MIENISLWAKNITLAVIVVSIFEMLLPNQKMKKYVKVVMGLYILFNIISPFVDKDISISMNEIIESSQAQVTTTEPIDQTSMDKRLKQISEQELEKNITKKVEDMGFSVSSCSVELIVDKETNIKQIILKIERVEQDKQNENVENILVEEIQKIKEVQIGKKVEKEQQDSDITVVDIEQIKKMLIKEYEVSEECIRIN